MNIQELFRQLSYGELSNLAIGLEGSGSIQENKKEAVIQFTNEALLRLYARFLLKESDIILECYDHITNYHLIKRFAKSNKNAGADDELYILDVDDKPFEDDIIKILEIYDVNHKQIALNDTERSDSFFTPQPTVLQIPRPKCGEVFAVTYQARHPILNYSDMTANIDLPYVLEGALKAYIAYQIYSNMNGQDHVARAIEHLNRYESICSNVTAMDLVTSSSSTTNQKFNQRGFI